MGTDPAAQFRVAFRAIPALMGMVRNPQNPRSGPVADLPLGTPNSKS